MRIRRVIDNDNPYVCGAQHIDERIKFVQGRLLLLFRRSGRATLKKIRLGRHRIALESCGTDHQDCGC